MGAAAKRMAKSEIGAPSETKPIAAVRSQLKKRCQIIQALGLISAMSFPGKGPA